MKTCPNCGELLGDSVNECFKCRYSFTLKRVLTIEDQTLQKIGKWKNKKEKKRKKLKEKKI